MRSRPLLLCSATCCAYSSQTGQSWRFRSASGTRVPHSRQVESAFGAICDIVASAVPTPFRRALHQTKTMTVDLRKIVIVGRPNVGKSTLFNRLAGKRRALTHDLPGMTRDRLSDVITLDNGRRFELTDTGGLEYGDSPMSAFAGEIRDQARRALDTPDFILFVVDGSAGILTEDRDIAQELRAASERTLLLVNKVDRKDSAENVSDFYELGYNRILALSAEHGEGVDELFDII